MVDLFNSQFFAAAKNLFVNPTDYFPLSNLLSAIRRASGEAIG